MTAQLKRRFVCRHCGCARNARHAQCPACRRWNAMREVESAGPCEALPRARSLAQFAVHVAPRIRTHIPGVDYVLGEGFVPGGSYFLFGAPGTGKSTLALQVGYWTAVRNGRAVCYASAEEQGAQVRQRAARLAVNPAWIVFDEVLRLSLIERRLLALRPALVIIDSVQMLEPGLELDPVAWHRAYRDLLRLLQRTQTAGLLLSQMNVNGGVMGGNRVAHLCDAVLELSCPGGRPETDPRRRLAAPTKNRHNKLCHADFTMTAEGLR